MFVDRQVWDLLPHHKKNQNVDFSPTVDSSEVFDFIDELVQDNRWIFQFQRTEEIAEILRTQLSARFHDLLTRAYTKRLDVPTGFEGESEQVIDFVVNGGDLWEYRLANALLKERLSKIDAKFIDVARGFVFRRSRFLSPRDTMPYIQDLLTDITGLLSAAGKVLNEEIVPGFGPPGVAGDAEQIKRGCDNLYSLFLELYEWELDVRFVRSHEIFSELFKTMHGWPDELLSEFRRLTRELADLLSSPNLSGQYTIDLVFHAPSGLANFSEGLEKLTNDPRLISLMAEEI